MPCNAKQVVMSLAELPPEMESLLNLGLTQQIAVNERFSREEKSTWDNLNAIGRRVVALSTSDYYFLNISQSPDSYTHAVSMHGNLAFRLFCQEYPEVLAYAQALQAEPRTDDLNDYVMYNLFGLIYLQSGYDKAYSLYRPVIVRGLDLANPEVSSAKDYLQKWAKARKLSIRYETSDKLGEELLKPFRSWVSISELRAMGEGETSNVAERAAAHAFISAYIDREYAPVKLAKSMSVYELPVMMNASSHYSSIIDGFSIHEAIADECMRTDAASRAAGFGTSRSMKKYVALGMMILNMCFIDSLFPSISDIIHEYDLSKLSSTAMSLNILENVSNNFEISDLLCKRHSERGKISAQLKADCVKALTAGAFLTKKMQPLPVERVSDALGALARHTFFAKWNDIITLNETVDHVATLQSICSVCKWNCSYNFSGQGNRYSAYLTITGKDVQIRIFDKNADAIKAIAKNALAKAAIEELQNGLRVLPLRNDTCVLLETFFNRGTYTAKLMLYQEIFAKAQIEPIQWSVNTREIADYLQFRIDNGLPVHAEHLEKLASSTRSFSDVRRADTFFTTNPTYLTKILREAILKSLVTMEY